MRNSVLIVLMLLGYFNLQAQDNSYPPEGFVYLQEVIPDIELEVRYHGNNNFMGRPVDGYTKGVIIISQQAATALKKVAADLRQQGYRLKVFDAYRPQRAVDSFVQWAKDPSDTLTKAAFYPQIRKNRLFDLGYIASRSGHTRGSTIDLTLLHGDSAKELDMGSPYDFFGDISHHGTGKISKQQERNRNILKDAMLRHGFRLYSAEWWHYSLRGEPFPDTYFDFPIK